MWGVGVILVGFTYAISAIAAPPCPYKHIQGLPAATSAYRPLEAALQEAKAQATAAEHSGGQAAEDRRHLVAFLEHLKAPEYEEYPETVDTLARLSRDSDFFSAFVALGKTSPRAREMVPADAFSYALSQIVAERNRFDKAGLNRALTDFAVAYQNETHEPPQTRYWHSQRVASLLWTAALPNRVRLRHELIETAPPGSDTARRVTQDNADTVYRFDSPEVRALFFSLLEKNLFSKERPDQFSFLFFTLAKALNEASLTTDPRRAELLRNTVNYVVSGKAQVEFGNTDENVLGHASGKNVTFSWNLNRADAIEVLAHEISHVAGKAKVEESVGYFEEEMRAWMVGYYASTGTVPSKAAAMLRAHQLLTATEGAYAYIARAWRAKPETFQRHLEDLGLGKLRPGLSYDYIHDLAEAHTLNEPAPLWGWDGFLVNKPAPVWFRTGETANPRIAEYFAHEEKLKQAAPSVDVGVMGRAILNLQSQVGALTPLGMATGHVLAKANAVDENGTPEAIHRAVEDTHDLIFAVWILAEMDGLWGRKDPNPEARYFLTLSTRTDLEPVFIRLGRAFQKRLHVDPGEAYESALTSLAPVMRAHPAKGSLLLGAFADAYLARSNETPAAGRPSWTQADTDELIRKVVK